MEYITNRGEETKRLGDEVDPIDVQDREQQLKLFARAREHLRLAANYLRQSPQIDRDCQRRAVARRAVLALDMKPIQPASNRAEAEALADLFSGRLLGQAERLVTPTGVACEHNCLSLSSAAAEMNAVAARCPGQGRRGPHRLVVAGERITDRCASVRMRYERAWRCRHVQIADTSSPCIAIPTTLTCTSP